MLQAEEKTTQGLRGHYELMLYKNIHTKLEQLQKERTKEASLNLNLLDCLKLEADYAHKIALVYENAGIKPEEKK